MDRVTTSSDTEIIRSFASQAYALLVRSGNVFQVALLLFFRLNWGWRFFVTGKGKLTNHQHILEFFTSLHLPFPDLTAWMVGGIECIGGILLLLGLAARPVGLVLAVNMIVAYLSVDDDRQAVFNFFQDQDPFLSADPFFYLLTALLSFAFGAGPLSVDGLIKKLLSKKNISAESGSTGKRAGKQSA